MDLSKMMKEAQRLQKEMLEAQNRLESMEFEGMSGGGLVSIVLKGDGRMRCLSLDDSLLADKSLLEDLLIAAYHDAKDQMDQRRTDEMGSVSKGLPKGLF